MQETTKFYVVTTMNNDYEVKVFGIFTSKNKAENAIKENIFSFAYQSAFDSYNTEDIPECEYIIHPIANIDEELL